jgi:predicted dehydrogenase
MNSIGWGVVGTGEISRHIVTDLQRLNPTHPLAVCSRTIARAREFAAEVGVGRAYGSVADLCADEAIDIVYIGTPHATHASIAIEALEAGKHVLVEKPMGIDANDVLRVAAAARASGRFAMEAMWMKFSPHYMALLDEVRSGTVGDIRSVRASFGLPFGDAASDRWSRELSSSALLDQGIYPVTLACDLLGMPRGIEARARIREDGVDLSDVATLYFDGERTAHIAASMVDFIDPSAAVNGTAGWITVPAPFWATNRFERHTGTLAEAIMQPTSAEFEREGMGYVPMLRAVERAIAAGQTEHPHHTLDATLAVARVLDDIRAAATIDEF